MFYTYLHCRPDGTPFYVGKGCGRRSHKFLERNRFHKNIVHKYGKDAIRIYVFPCESEEQAFADEAQQISQLRTDGFELANVERGGSVETGGRAGRKHSTEERRKISESLRWNKNMLGKKHGEETKRKMSTWHKGKTKSAETRARMSLAQKGLKIGSKNALGHRLSAEAKARISLAVKRHWELVRRV